MACIVVGAAGCAAASDFGPDGLGAAGFADCCGADALKGDGEAPVEFGAGAVAGFGAGGVPAGAEPAFEATTPGTLEAVGALGEAAAPAAGALDEAVCGDCAAEAAAAGCGPV